MPEYFVPTLDGEFKDWLLEEINSFGFVPEDTLTLHVTDTECILWIEWHCKIRRSTYTEVLCCWNKELMNDKETTI